MATKKTTPASKTSVKSYSPEQVKRMQEVKTAAAKAKAGAKVTTPEGYRAMQTAARLEGRKAPAAAKAVAKTKGGTLAKIGRGISRGVLPRTPLGIAATTAALTLPSVFSAMNKNAKTGKMPGGNQNATSGRGGRPQGFVENKSKSPKGNTSSPFPKGGAITGKSKTPAAKTSGKYRVQSGDTLSGIAKRAGVTLAELRAANPQIADPRKIFRNTGVNIPKGGTKPEPGYTGPIPYKPPTKQNLPYKGGATIVKGPYKGGASTTNLPYKGGTTDSQMDEKLRKKMAFRKSPKADGLE